MTGTQTGPLLMGGTFLATLRGVQVGEVEVSPTCASVGTPRQCTDTACLHFGVP